MKPNMISTCLALIGLLHPLVCIASTEGQYRPLQPPQCGYSNVNQAEVPSVVLAKRDRVRPICLPLTNALESKNRSGSYAAGWGPFIGFLSDISGWIRFDHLMEVQVRVVSNEICRKADSSYKMVLVDNRVLCVESINPEEQHCKGISGSPLMLSQGSAFYEIGFVSHGSVGNDSPCIYTRVSAYMDFITSALK